MTSVIKYSIIFVLLVIGSLVSRANDNNYLLALTYTEDGEGSKTTYVKLTEKPIISFSAKNIEISGVNISLLYENVTSISFVDEETTNIDEISTKNKEIPQIAFLSNSTLLVSGLIQGGKVTLYSIDGKVLSKQPANEEGKASISLENLPNGAYVVKTNKKSFKILKK